MIRQRALAWAAVLALVATVPIAPLPTRFSAPVALAQDDSAADAGEPTDLAIVALQCAEAPAAEALTSFFSTEGGTDRVRARRGCRNRRHGEWGSRRRQSIHD